MILKDNLIFGHWREINEKIVNREGLLLNYEKLSHLWKENKEKKDKRAVLSLHIVL